MQFNTPEFVVFFLLVAVVVYIANRLSLCKVRNVLLLIASYAFYANLHIYYPLLLLFVTMVNFIGGRWLQLSDLTEKKRKFIISAVVVFSLIPLVTLKYAPVYTDSLWLPVGLSFFTFQSLTYSLDVYRGKITEKYTLLDVSLFIAFFPTLLSGPIERARNVIPQLREKLPFNWENTIEGAQTFTWGLFKKMVIADRLAEWVNTIYAQGPSASGGTLAVAAILYSFQIYCDFSGYASMAIGVGRMLGIKLMENFCFPYFASSIKDFWRRWHISLTSWFTEYVYISMGGNRVSRVRWILNISCVFILSGVWHGATWSFVIWGAMHAVLYLIEYYTGFVGKSIFYRIFVFVGVTLAWVFFRVENSAEAASMIAKMFTGPWLPVKYGVKVAPIAAVTIGVLISFIVIEYAQYKKKLPTHWLWRSAGFALMIICISLFSASSSQFVYFKF